MNGPRDPGSGIRGSGAWSPGSGSQGVLPEVVEADAEEAGEGLAEPSPSNSTRSARHEALPAYSRDQLRRASFSIALNLAEGYGRESLKDRVRFYSIALGSLREVQSIIQAEELTHLAERADHLGACLWKLVHQ
jgi:four helix bundle protein